MNVTLLVRDYDHVNGLARYDRLLYEHLCHRPDMHVHLVPMECAAIPQLLVKAAKRLGLNAEAFFRAYPLKWPLEGQDGEIFHLTHRTFSTLLYGRVARPVVVTVHDIIHFQQRRDLSLNYYQNPVHKGFDMLSIRALRRADAVLTSSEYTRSVLLDDLDVPVEKVHCVYLGVDRAQFRPVEVPEWFWRKYNLDPSGDYLLHVGTEEARKNIGALVEALAITRTSHRHVKLLRVGRSLYAGRHEILVERVRSLGLEDAVLWIDDVPDEDLVYFYNLSRVFVFPSLAEGFGLPVLEAMACGLPVVCSDAASLPEIAGGAASLVNPHDVPGLAMAINSLLEDRVLSARRGRAGLVNVAAFSWARTAQETAEVYKSVLEGRSA